MENIKDKHHFFIGNIFDDENQIKILRNVQKKLRKKYSLKNPHWNNKFFTNLIYLGYFDNETANLYMENVVTNLLKAIGDKFNELTCEYTGFKIEYDNSFYKISLKFTDTENYLEKIIVPYLHNNAILPIYDKKKNILKPAIDLIYYKSSYLLGTDKDASRIRIQVPTEKFKFNHIALIKGTTVRVRSGTPSLHDQMSLEEISRFKFPLEGTI